MEWLNEIGKKYSTKSHIQCPGHKSHTATSELPDAAHLSQERPGFQPRHVLPHQPSAWEGFSWGSGPSWVLGVHCFITQGTEITENCLLMMLVLCLLDDVLTSDKKGSSSRSNLCSLWSGSGSLFPGLTLWAHSVLNVGGVARTVDISWYSATPELELWDLESPPGCGIEWRKESAMGSPVYDHCEPLLLCRLLLLSSSARASGWKPPIKT